MRWWARLRARWSAARERKQVDPSRAAATAFLDRAARHSWDRDEYPQRCSRCETVRTFETEDERCSHAA